MCDTDAPEPVEVPVVSRSCPWCDSDVGFECTNFNGGMTVTGYVPGVMGVTTAGGRSDESECCEGWPGAVGASGVVGSGAGSASEWRLDRGNSLDVCSLLVVLA